jgi:GT2 family glycosyltransferase
MSKTSIFITSWNRVEFTLKTIKYIHERTIPGTFELHIYDNGSTLGVQDRLYSLIGMNKITSITFDSRNTGCLYNKLIFHSMVESSDKYMCITDNDVYPPKLSPDWLSQMIDIMDKHPEIAMLAPQLPPQFLQMPYQVLDDVVYTKAIGNTFKVCRMSAMKEVIPKIEQKLGVYGDDGLVSELLEKNGWKIAFCKNLYCLHAGQCDNWGYKPEEVNQDPRKSGYGKPFSYNLVNEDTFEPETKWKI